MFGPFTECAQNTDMKSSSASKRDCGPVLRFITNDVLYWDLFCWSILLDDAFINTPVDKNLWNEPTCIPVIINWNLTNNKFVSSTDVDQRHSLSQRYNLSSTA